MKKTDLGTDVSAESESSLVDYLTRSLKQNIQTGRLAAGQRVIEADLQNQFKASRGTIREALRRMVAEGYMTSEHNRGISVRRMTQKEFLDQHRIREVLEGLSARLAAEYVQENGQPPMFKRHLAEMKKAAKNSNSARYFELNEQLHRMIAEMSGNNLLLQMIVQMSSHAFALRLHNPMNTEEMLRSDQEHSTIYAALIKGDPDSAELAMRAHIRRSSQMVKQISSLGDSFL